MAIHGRLVPPTACLPKLSALANCSVEQLTHALDNLRAIYCRSPMPPLSLKLPAQHFPKHVIHDLSALDSGYASAEDVEDDEDVEETGIDGALDPDILPSDAFERNFAVRWLTGFASRSDTWVYAPPEEEESDARALLVDSAVAILGALAGEQEEEALTREFVFPYRGGEKDIEVELNDAPLLSTDHTSVGLQSWASSILLSERLCADPQAFGLEPCPDAMPLRILELGAGTGLLSIVSARILQRQRSSPSPPSHHSVVATDYHSSVLDNLRANVSINFVSSGSSEDLASPVAVRALDWEHPVYEDELARTFDIIFAADVVYHREHARWIKACVERLLAQPDAERGGEGGVFWLIVPLRIAGHHRGMSDTVGEVFPSAAVGGVGEGWKLGVLAIEDMERCKGVGRADEGGYKLFKIGWVRG